MKSYQRKNNDSCGFLSLCITDDRHANKWSPSYCQQWTAPRLQRDSESPEFNTVLFTTGKMLIYIACQQRRYQHRHLLAPAATRSNVSKQWIITLIRRNTPKSRLAPEPLHYSHSFDGNILRVSTQPTLPDQARYSVIIIWSSDDVQCSANGVMNFTPSPLNTSMLNRRSAACWIVFAQSLLTRITKGRQSRVRAPCTSTDRHLSEDFKPLKVQQSVARRICIASWSQLTVRPLSPTALAGAEKHAEYWSSQRFNATVQPSHRGSSTIFC